MVTLGRPYCGSLQQSSRDVTILLSRGFTVPLFRYCLIRLSCENFHILLWPEVGHVLLNVSVCVNNHSLSLWIFTFDDEGALIPPLLALTIYLAFELCLDVNKSHSSFIIIGMYLVRSQWRIRVYWRSGSSSEPPTA